MRECLRPIPAHYVTSTKLVSFNYYGYNGNGPATPNSQPQIRILLPALAAQVCARCHQACKPGESPKVRVGFR